MVPGHSFYLRDCQTIMSVSFRNLEAVAVFSGHWMDRGGLSQADQTTPLAKKIVTSPDSSLLVQ